MLFHRVGSSGLVISDLTLGTFEWGTRVEPDAAQDLVDEFAEAGGTLIELPSGGGPALEVLAHLRIPETVRIIGRIGTDRTGVHNDRLTLRSHVDRLLRTLGKECLDLAVLDAFDAETPLDETAETLELLRAQGKIGYLAAAHHEGWELACLRSAGITVTASISELSLLEREAEYTVLPAAEYLGIGVIAAAALGRGVLTGQYQGGIPRDSRAATPTADWVSGYLDDEHQSIVAGVMKAASALGVDPVDVALAWNRTLPAASHIVSPRTAAQLTRLLDSTTVLEPEIIDALNDVSAL